VRGTATDNSSVSSITVKFYRVRGGVKQYWNGTAWGTVSVPAAISTTGLGTASATWNLSPAPNSGVLDSGAYGVWVQAKDSAGNVSAAVSRSFMVAVTSSLKYKPSGSGKNF
jgi:hypothetical protein